jgi:hypothetical protein
MVFLAEHDVQRLVQLLEDRKREYVRRLAAYQRQSVNKDTPRDLVRALVREKFALQDESEIDWIERCLVQLKTLGAPDRATVSPPGGLRKRGQ